MIRTIQAAFAPLLIVSMFSGVYVFEYPVGRPRPYLAWLYFLCAWSIYTCTYYYLRIATKEQIISLPWNIFVIIISSFVSMIASLFRFKELKTCLHALSIVDDTLEVLGTPKEYRQLYRWMVGMIIAWIAMVMLLNVLDVLWETTESNFNVRNIFTLLVENHILHLSIVNSLMLGTILGYTGSRFERVNKHVNNLLENDAELTGSAPISVGRQRVLEVEECGRRVWIVMHVHLQLSLLSRELNKVFSLQMTLEMASLFVISVKQLFEIHSIFVDRNKDTLHQVLANLSIYIWTGMFTAKLFALNYICQNVSDKANETIAILYKLSNDDTDGGLREQTLQFILQIKKREVKFSGMGLFFFGDNFVRKFYTSLVTVLIIIIQMSGSNSCINHDIAPSTCDKY